MRVSGLTPEGTAEKFILDGDNTYGGRVVTNPSGGLLSKGHPLGATGLAQCAELVWQLRGEAGDRQVEGAQLALQHNLGLGGACVVTLYEKDRPMSAESLKGYQLAREHASMVERGRVACSPSNWRNGPGLLRRRRRPRARATRICWHLPPSCSGSISSTPTPSGCSATHGVDLSAVLHGEQRFTYHREVHAGDTLTLRAEFTDYYAKRNGALEFLVAPLGADLGRTARRRDGERVRHPEWSAIVTTDTADIQVGTELPPLAVQPISRTTLALFAGASGDHNPIHIDLDAAREAGFDDVFAHGMLSMAYLGRLITSWVPQAQLRSLTTRFTRDHTGARSTNVQRHGDEHRRRRRRDARHHRCADHTRGWDGDPRRVRPWWRCAEAPHRLVTWSVNYNRGSLLQDRVRRAAKGEGRRRGATRSPARAKFCAQAAVVSSGRSSVHRPRVPQRQHGRCRIGGRAHRSGVVPALPQEARHSRPGDLRTAGGGRSGRGPGSGGRPRTATSARRMFLSELADLVLEREEVLLWKRERRQLSESEQDEFRLKLNEVLRLTVQALGLGDGGQPTSDAELRAWSVLAIYSSVAPARKRLDDAAAKRSCRRWPENVLHCELDGAPTSSAPPLAPPRRPPGRRERILSTATRLFHAQSYHAVGIEEIAAESDTAIATFYQYFNGKAELLQAVLNRGAEGLHYVTNHRLPAARTPQEAIDIIACTLIELALGPHQPILAILAADLVYLPEKAQEAIRMSERDYLDEWVAAILGVRPELSAVSRPFARPVVDRAGHRHHADAEHAQPSGHRRRTAPAGDCRTRRLGTLRSTTAHASSPTPALNSLVSTEGSPVVGQGRRVAAVHRTHHTGHHDVIGGLNELVDLAREPSRAPARRGTSSVSVQSTPANFSRTLSWRSTTPGWTGRCRER